MFPDGRRVVSCDGDYKTPGVIKVWDVATSKCLATLEGHSNTVRCGVRCTFVTIWLRRRSVVLPYLRTGGASFLGTRRATYVCGTSRPANAWRCWQGTMKKEEGEILEGSENMKMKYGARHLLL